MFVVSALRTNVVILRQNYLTNEKILFLSKLLDKSDLGIFEYNTSGHTIARCS